MGRLHARLHGNVLLAVENRRLRHRLALSAVDREVLVRSAADLGIRRRNPMESGHGLERRVRLGRLPSGRPALVGPVLGLAPAAGPSDRNPSRTPRVRETEAADRQPQQNQRVQPPRRRASRCETRRAATGFSGRRAPGTGRHPSGTGRHASRTGHTRRHTPGTRYAPGAGAAGVGPSRRDAAGPSGHDAACDSARRAACAVAARRRLCRPGRERLPSARQGRMGDQSGRAVDARPAFASRRNAPGAGGTALAPVQGDSTESPGLAEPSLRGSEHTQPAFARAAGTPGQRRAHEPAAVVAAPVLGPPNGFAAIGFATASLTAPAPLSAAAAASAAQTFIDGGSDGGWRDTCMWTSWRRGSFRQEEERC